MWTGYLLLESFTAGVMTAFLIGWLWQRMRSKDPYYLRKGDLSVPICGSTVIMDGIKANVISIEQNANHHVYVIVSTCPYNIRKTSLYLPAFWTRVETYNGRRVVYLLD